MGNAGSDIITLATSLTIVTSSFFVTHSVTNGTRPSLSEAHNMFKSGTTSTRRAQKVFRVRCALHIQVHEALSKETWKFRKLQSC